MIKGFTPRLYQEAIYSSCVLKNTLVVLPTGLGKTNIFVMIAAQRLIQYPDSKILLIGPTRPLIKQYYDVFLKHFKISKDQMAIFTGMVPPKKREQLWKASKIVFSTPQGLENDILSRRIEMGNVSLLGIDEAHRAVGEYSYVWIAKQYESHSRFPRIVGLTASPGADKEKIEEVCRNLYIENIEARDHDDPDVKPYIKEISVNYVSVDLPEDFLKAKRYLDECFKSKLKEIKQNGFLSSAKYISKKDLLSLQGQLVGEMSKGNKYFLLLKSISLIAEAMKVSHAIELLESQGISPLKNYMEKLFSQARTSKVKAVQNLVKDINFKSAFILVEKLSDQKQEHPKLDKLKEIITKIKKEDIKIIVFTQFRDSAIQLEKNLNELEGVSARIFVGQQKKGETGLSQKKQIEMLEEFREGAFNTIIMTSVGEEGLDIPSVDLVVFYEPVPSAIRTIQRRGRTGRQEKGNVIVLVSKNTRDEAYRWAAHHKEKRMYSILQEVKKGIVRNKKPREQASISEFVYEEKIYIYADFREKGSPVLKRLMESGVHLKIEKLDNADYQLSPRVAVEYKTVEDFVLSLIDGRLLSQVKDISSNFSRPIIIVEGTSDIFKVRNVHPNAIRGMIATITISFGIPLLFTRDSKETAAMLWMIAKREQQQSGKEFSPHGEKKNLSLKEQQEYIVSSFPGIGPLMAKEILKNFKTIKKIVNSEEDHLKKVPKVGPKIAERLREVFDSEYPTD